MKILLNPEEWALNLYDNIVDSKDLKISDYIIHTEYENEILILHTITWAIYCLSKDEFYNILTNETLIKNKVVVPNDLDESEIANKAYVSRLSRKNLPTYDTIDSYIIMTTTACNARCSYCYEKNVSKRESMTLETAENVVQFMLKRSPVYEGKKQVNIQWFGGEPMLNKPIIDYICSRLRELDFNFTTTMISNGFLLNEENLKTVKNWNLRMVQITLDGLYETYNKTKNYVYTDVDAYLTVINNIRYILENTNVKVNVRINANNDNIFNIYDDIIFLKEEFKEYYNNRFLLYVSPIFQLTDDDSYVVNGFDKELTRLLEITDVLRPERCSDGETSQKILKRRRLNSNCMAFSGKAVNVTPSGNLTPCEHIIETDILGNVVDGITDVSVIKKWNTFDDIDKIKFCIDTKCQYHPMCAKLYNCENEKLCKTEFRKNQRIDKIKTSLINTKKYYDEEIEKIKGGQ